MGISRKEIDSKYKWNIDLMYCSKESIEKDIEKIKYYNEYGGFSEDGKEYLIKITKENRLPTVWSHIMANEKFGCVTTENMGGYSWFLNSRLNRVSSWENNPSYDIPSEIIYLKNKIYLLSNIIVFPFLSIKPSSFK